jgi:hypothetical protein
MPRESNPPEQETEISTQEKQIFMSPIGAIARPMSSYGHTLGGSNLINRENQAVVSKLIDRILKSPTSKLHLSHRVYELLINDIRDQKERSKTYQGRL